MIGGTRNLGLSIVELLCQRGHSVAVFNRGITAGELPVAVERLYGDRGKRQEVQRAIGSRSFDAVIDTALYTGADTRTTIDVLKDKTGHYVFISTGQVYLIRKDLVRPFREEDYDGELMTPSAPDHADYKDWLYGKDKRDAEDLLFQSWDKERFPVTSLRLPMVNSERDHYGRILGYVRRLEDGGPILVPEGNALSLRHVYGEDVAKAAVALIESGRGKGIALNLAQDETTSLEEFLTMIAGILSVDFKTVKFPRTKLGSLKLLPSCSPFSDPWMSALDNSRSKNQFGIQYTPLREYLRHVVAHYKDNPRLVPEGYKTRELELRVAAEIRQ
ncbi:MAG TPA: NAD-dependent epimerase/dehydratase family protein [Verrucomicrobiae bacterium]|jgi:nucleoside-diphosphate-sugar epimerase|nr:NAD-dependent epimerase/dehydratase family protein [Verrucomicrobiae bacterium]